MAQRSWIGTLSYLKGVFKYNFLKDFFKRRNSLLIRFFKVDGVDENLENSFDISSDDIVLIAGDESINKSEYLIKILLEFENIPCMYFNNEGTGFPQLVKENSDNCLFRFILSDTFGIDSIIKATEIFAEQIGRTNKIIVIDSVNSFTGFDIKEFKKLVDICKESNTLLICIYHIDVSNSKFVPSKLFQNILINADKYFTFKRKIDG